MVTLFLVVTNLWIGAVWSTSSNAAIGRTPTIHHSLSHHDNVMQELWREGEIQVRVENDESNKSDFWKENSINSDDAACQRGEEDPSAFVGLRIAQSLVEAVAAVSSANAEAESTQQRALMGEPVRSTACGLYSHDEWLLEEIVGDAESSVAAALSVVKEQDSNDPTTTVTVRLNKQVLLTMGYQHPAADSQQNNPQDVTTTTTRHYRFRSVPDPHVFQRYDQTFHHDGHSVSMNDNDDSFCATNRMTMVMFMDGFHQSLFRSNNSTMLHCLNYYFTNWTLSDAGKFHGAMVYSFLTAILTQGLTVVRALVLRNCTKRVRKPCAVLFYTVQQLMGYILMFVAMMYSVELLLSVVAGVMVGHVLFYPHEPPKRAERDNEAPEREPLLPRADTSNEENLRHRRSA